METIAAHILQDVLPSHLGNTASLTGQDLVGGLLALYGVYLIVLEVGGFLRAQPVPSLRPHSRFAILVPAHDEQAVIGQLVDSLRRLDYPRHLYDIFVVADNCGDATASVARAAGARVFERRSRRRGKGYALAFGWRQIRRLGRYDAMVVLDADNLVPPGFIGRLNDHLLAGHPIIQCRKQAKNPSDNAVTALKTLVLWTSDRFVFAPKSRLGFSSVLLGAGMCISAEVLDRLGWRAFCLTEDFEFTAQALLAGYRVYWADDTVVYEEQPSDLGSAVRQHVRWARGQNQVFFRYAWRLLTTGLLRRDPRRVEAAAQTAQSFVPVVGAAAAILGWIVWARTGQVLLWDRIPFWVWAAATVIQSLMPIPAFRQYRGADPSPLYWLWLYPLVLFGLICVSVYALGTVRRGRWDVTPHRRSISVAEIAGADIEEPPPRGERLMNR